MEKKKNEKLTQQSVYLSNVQHLFFSFPQNMYQKIFLYFLYVGNAECIVKLANPVAWETKATLKQATAKKVQLVLQHWWIPPHESNLSQSNLSCNKCGCYRLRKIVAESSSILFFIGKQVHSADIPLRMKDEFALTNWSNILFKEGCLALSVSPYKVLLMDYSC